MIKIAIKDLMQFFKQKRTMLLTFLLPIVLITLFAFAFGGIGGGSGDSRISLQISDLDQTQTSKKAAVLFDSLKGLEIKPTELSIAQDNIKKGKESFVLIFKKGFADSVNAGYNPPLELQYDEAKETEVGLLQQSLIPTIAMMPFSLGDPKTTMANRFNNMAGTKDNTERAIIKERSDKLFDDLSAAMSRSNSSGGSAADFLGGNIKMTKLIAANNDNELGLIQAVAGTAVMMLLFSVVGIGSGLLDEKQEGTLKRLLYAPINPLNILFGKMISANVISILQLLVMFVFAALCFGLSRTEHLPGTLITIAATAFACSAFGVFLASFAKTRQQVQGLSTMVVLVMSAIGGSMMPLFFMPALMQKAAVLSVNYWSIQSFYDVFWRNLSITDPSFLKKIVVLVFIGLILNVLAVIMFRKNILKLS